MQVVQAFVRQAMGFLESAPTQADKVELIKTLQSITEGKVGPTTPNSLTLGVWVPQTCCPADAGHYASLLLLSLADVEAHQAGCSCV